MARTVSFPTVHALPEPTLAAVENAGGVILRPIFPFPGGRRVHFADPAGNEMAVWSEAA